MGRVRQCDRDGCQSVQPITHEGLAADAPWRTLIEYDQAGAPRVVFLCTRDCVQLYHAPELPELIQRLHVGPVAATTLPLHPGDPDRLRGQLERPDDAGAASVA